MSTSLKRTVYKCYLPCTDRQQLEAEGCGTQLPDSKTVYSTLLMFQLSTQTTWLPLPSLPAYRNVKSTIVCISV